MGGIQYQQLLTDEDRRAHLHAIFGHRFTMQNKLQLPTFSQYNHLSDNESLQSVSTEICRWIGLKPNGLNVSFDDVHTSAAFTTDQHAKTIRISSAYRHHTYSTGALLVFAIIAYAVEKFDHLIPNTAFIEFASIELGLGLWIVNALPTKTQRRLYQAVDSAWQYHDVIRLSTYSPNQYAERIARYAHKNRIPPDVYLPHVRKRSQYLFSSFTTAQTVRFLPESHDTLQRKRRTRRRLAKLILGASITAGAITLAIYIYTVDGHITPNQQAQQRIENIEVLKNKYDDCQEKASQQQSTYDPNDLFLTRQIDATKAHCESLRNQYNYEVDQYRAANY